MNGFFITGSDTGVGKTLIAAALSRALVLSGQRVRVRKPVESGCDERPGGLVPLDAILLREAAQTDEPLEKICPFPLKRPLSPERAARFEGKTFRLADVVAASALAPRCPHEFFLVEGAGGFLSPLCQDALCGDLAQSVGLPLLAVIPDRLGAINQALLLKEAADRRGLTIGAFILNEPLGIRAVEGMDNAEDIHRWTGLRVFAVPRIVSEQPWKMLAERMHRWMLADWDLVRPAGCACDS